MLQRSSISMEDKRGIEMKRKWAIAFFEREMNDGMRRNDIKCLEF